MKAPHSTLAAACAAAAAISSLSMLCSCSCSPSGSGDGAPEVTSMQVAMDLKNADAFYRAPAPGGGDSIYVNLSASLQWPTRVGDADLAVLGDSILAIGFNAPAGTSPEQAMRQFASEASARAMLPDSVQPQAVAQVPGAVTGVWYSIVNGSVVEINERMVTYVVTASGYQGGAHPYTASRPFTYDLAHGRVVTMDNLFVRGSHDAVLSVVKRALARARNVEVAQLADAGIFVDQFTDPGQPYVTDDVLMFHFNPYDIACYADGPIDVAVYPDEVARWLTPEAKQLLQVQE